MTFLIIITGILLRLIPHLPNFAPISATAIFSGATLNKKIAFFVPLVSLAISDYLLLYISPFSYPIIDFSHLYPLSSLFHSTTFFVWGSLVISGFIGILIKKNLKSKFIILASLSSSIQFFIITNLGVWITTNMYPHTVNGLIKCYIMGLPFFKGTLLGDLFYTGIFFGTFAFANKFKNSFQMLKKA